MQEQITRFVEMFNDALAMLPEFASDVWNTYVLGYRMEALIWVFIPLVIIFAYIFILRRLDFGVKYSKKMLEDLETEREAIDLRNKLEGKMFRLKRRADYYADETDDLVNEINKTLHLLRELPEYKPNSEYRDEYSETKDTFIWFAIGGGVVSFFAFCRLCNALIQFLFPVYHILKGVF